MCGIFGVVSAGSSALNTFNELGQLNTVRGNVHHGWVGMYSASITPRCSPYAWMVKRYLKPFNEVTTLELPVMLGHVRAPTGGQNDELTEVHPFETSDLLLMHNGIILNCETLPQWKIGPVDSQTIIGGIQWHIDQGHSTIAAIRNTVELLDGQQGCVLIDKRTGRIYLWRVISTIYTSTRSDSVIFSSMRCSLADHLLLEGIIYSVYPHGLNICTSFRFYSPYSV